MNKLKSLTKRTSAIFLAIVLVTGTIATLLSQSSFIVGAQAQPHYNGGMDSSYNSYEPSQYPSYNNYKSKDSNVSINKLKCFNTNLNINGNNTGDFNLGNKRQVPITQEGYLGANPYDDEGYYDGYGNNKKGKGFVCIINNNNNNTNINVGIGSGDNQTTPGNQTIPPQPTTATLHVRNLIFCLDLGPPTPSNRCDRLLETITEDQYLIQVTGINPVPSSQFPGSEAGTVVTLGPGNFVVSVTPDDSIQTDIAALKTEFGLGPFGTGYEILFPNGALFHEGCIGSGFEAVGAVAAGKSQSCFIYTGFQIYSPEP